MTRDHPEMERLLLNVVEQVCKATLERVARAKSDENEDDQAENDITQGRSVVFSILEISLYVVSKYASDMIPAASRKPNLHTTKKSYKGKYFQCTLHFLFILKDYIFLLYEYFAHGFFRKCVVRCLQS